MVNHQFVVFWVLPGPATRRADNLPAIAAEEGLHAGSRSVVNRVAIEARNKIGGMGTDRVSYVLGARGHFSGNLLTGFAY
mmetsp:Transcript_9391/g.16618  ORF Transcript_9391/g.16618 Transcript_9391/m.16618 type:complete len:80 (-) Transcript_9391:22-261(-)